MGCGWGKGSGAVNAVRLPRILVLTCEADERDPQRGVPHAAILETQHDGHQLAQDPGLPRNLAAESEFEGTRLARSERGVWSSWEQARYGICIITHSKKVQARTFFLGRKTNDYSAKA